MGYLVLAAHSHPVIVLFIKSIITYVIENSSGSRSLESKHRFFPSRVLFTISIVGFEYISSKRGEGSLIWRNGAKIESTCISRQGGRICVQVASAYAIIIHLLYRKDDMTKLC